jgi:hypothetical protein
LKEHLMMHRSLSLVIVAVALALLVSQPVLADQTHEGKVVTAGNGKLTMTGKDAAQQHTHNVPADVKITCDGKECKLEDLKAGYQLKVTTKDDGKTVTKIEAKSKPE